MSHSDSVSPLHSGTDIIFVNTGDTSMPKGLRKFPCSIPSAYTSCVCNGDLFAYNLRETVYVKHISDDTLVYSGKSGYLCVLYKIDGIFIIVDNTILHITENDTPRDYTTDIICTTEELRGVPGDKYVIGDDGSFDCIYFVIVVTATTGISLFKWNSTPHYVPVTNFMCIVPNKVRVYLSSDTVREFVWCFTTDDLPRPCSWDLDKQLMISGFQFRSEILEPINDFLNCKTPCEIGAKFYHAVPYYDNVFLICHRNNNGDDVSETYNDLGAFIGDIIPRNCYYAGEGPYGPYFWCGTGIYTWLHFKHTEHFKRSKHPKQSKHSQFKCREHVKAQLVIDLKYAAVATVI